jgi:hypothetical protein
LAILPDNGFSRHHGAHAGLEERLDWHARIDRAADRMDGEPMDPAILRRRDPRPIPPWAQAI